ncbi:MAG TPA: alpha-1,4-glucan--maltose-1-phosphate maltosyltransferase [Rhizomicrobium sp.]
MAMGQRASVGEDGRDLFAPRIYYFHPLLAGPRLSWPWQLRRCRDMGFDCVLTAPLFAPGAAGDLFLTGDHERPHPAIEDSLDADQLINELARDCRDAGLNLLLDIVLGRVANNAGVTQSHPGWFRDGNANGHAVDPRNALPAPAAAYLRFDQHAVEPVTEWWIERLLRLASAGVSGFCCSQPQLVPRQVWRRIIAAVAQSVPDIRFVAWTPGLNWSDITALQGIGFDGAFSSAPWWDGRANWFIEEHELLRGLGAVIASPEAPFGPRLARRLAHVDNPVPLYRHMLQRAAAIGDGIIVPMGFEYAAADDMDARQESITDALSARPSSNADLSEEIREANALSAELKALKINREMRRLTDPGEPVTALIRSDGPSARDASAPIVVVINTDLAREKPLPIDLEPLPPAAGASLMVAKTIVTERDRSSALAAGEIRVLQAHRSDPIETARPDAAPKALAAAPRIVIDKLVPSVDGGRFAAKRVIGDPIIVEADVFTDGHETLGVELLWRSANQRDWSRSPMRIVNNDRWRATIHPERIGRYELTVEAWIDSYGTLARDIELKRAAGADVANEITEARRVLDRAHKLVTGGEGKVIASALKWLSDASTDESADILLTRDLREVMYEAGGREFVCRRKPAISLDVERPQALFAAWYELFPRSTAATSDRHGTLTDVIGRLPGLQQMGFDVLYLTPIHPIGSTNRKGRNNLLDAAPDDVGSPYAIGNKDGGHDAIHSALGTIEDFRQLRDAAAEHGLELALDFAIQCSPDHPWLKDHPEWFNWRPDGSIRFAENPPKKYEDIVNVDFYAKDAIPDLWLGLRNIVLFWVDEGVRIFRVDNPHTKPLPFWEWLINEVRSQHPDVIFLSEAFTRPKMMNRLAKVGFSQSYTYFTWRNTKQDLVEYFTELTTSEVKEFFRPHLFVNTPDINPFFLQTSGRPGFLIRAALAATLSGLWGMYSGFELCEAAPLQGREEYLDSEKYEIRARRLDAPGNIVAEIGKLNRIRKAHPALQTHLGLRFYLAHNDQVIFYGKGLLAGRSLILCAISLDPFHVQEATVEVPLWEWGLPDTASFTAYDLMHDTETVRSGKLQRLRLDPAELPFVIWRIAPLEA